MTRVIDGHFHFDPAMVSIGGLIASMDSFGIERTALIPSLNPPLYPPRFVTAATAALRFMLDRGPGPIRRLGLMLYENTVKNDGTVDILGQRYEIKAQPRNDEVVDAIAGHPDRFWGWVFVNPEGPVDPVGEIERLVQGRGMIGVKAHPYWHDYPVTRLADAAALCSELGWPMLIHLGADDRGDFRFLPETFPRLNLIYAHAGIPYYREVIDYAARKSNVLVDLSSSGYVDFKIASYALRRLGAGKLIFGTDGPYFHCRDDRFDHQPFLDLIQRLSLSDFDREKVMGQNLRDLIKL